MHRRQAILGWIALGISMLIAALWAFWGIMEAFHEGWWAATLGGRLLQTAAYLTPMGICLVMGALAIRWPKIGAAIYFSLGAAFSFLIFREMWPDFKLAAVLSWLPVTLLVVGVGVLWWFSQPRPLRLAYSIFVGIPLLVVLCCGAYPAYKVSTRNTDVSLKARLVDEPQHLWRLPTVEAAARSMARHGVNCGGRWDEQAKRALYEVQPDKEPPLWDPFAETVYWWTATEDGAENAFIIVYDGKVWSRRKTQGLGSQGFRAVKDVPEGDTASQPAPGRN